METVKHVKAQTSDNLKRAATLASPTEVAIREHELTANLARILRIHDKTMRAQMELMMELKSSGEKAGILVHLARLSGSISETKRKIQGLTEPPKAGKGGLTKKQTKTHEDYKTRRAKLDVKLEDDMKQKMALDGKLDKLCSHEEASNRDHQVAQAVARTKTLEELHPKLLVVQVRSDDSKRCR